MLEITEDHLILHLKVIPKSSKTTWGKVIEGRIQLKITDPPIDGAANKACIRFLSKEFKSPKSMITILKGETSRQKTVMLKGYSPELVDNFKNSVLQE